MKKFSLALVVGFLSLFPLLSFADSEIASLLDDVVKFEALNDSQQKAKAMNAILASGEGAVEPLAKKLNDPKTSIQDQWTMAYLLGKIRSEKAVEPLVSNLVKTDNDWQRSVIQSALETIGSPSAKPLLKILKDEQASLKENPKWEVSLAANRAALVLATLGEKDSIPLTLDLLKIQYNRCQTGKTRSGAAAYVKRDLMRALVTLAATDAKDLLAEMAKNDTEIPTYAAEYLGKMKLAEAGKNPFEITRVKKPLNPKRVYGMHFGAESYYFDLESGEKIPFETLPPGTVSR